MMKKQKIAVIAKAVLEIIKALHDYAPDCGRCTLPYSPVCLGRGSLIDKLEAIAEVDE